MADETKKDQTAVDEVDDNRFRGLDNVMSAAKELADSLRETTVSVGTVAEKELSLVVDLAEDIRDRAISPELLKEARGIRVVSGLRVTSHRVVDLGFDALSVSLKLSNDALDSFLSAPRDDTSTGLQTAG